ncbi:hypothetical protein TWF970_005480 [Orbilia oligospora]|uniref:GRF-type domain-containing protein n=1 Tax=Orbilia oligospora TaxID=2813651 RepID=A0A7C8VVM6_ORBOL|nr:hypothetical protein TWF970_005480 [Orbilia oligospora]
MNGDEIAVDSPTPRPTNASLSSQKNGIFVKNQWMCNCTPRLPGVLNKVRKMGKNEGRQFWTCSKKSGPRPGCGFWLWIEEARDRERKALMVNGQMPPNKGSPSRPLRQTKISDSFRPGKSGEGSFTKSSLQTSTAKGKAPVRFKEMYLEEDQDAISIPSDIENDPEEGVPYHLDTDSDGDTQFEDALGEPVLDDDDDDLSAPANGVPSSTVNPQHLPDDAPSDESSEGPRKIARTKNNTSPSKHLLDSPAAMSVSHIPPSTESTVADNIAYQNPDMRSMSSAAKERYARQWDFDSVDPVSFPDLGPYLERPVPSPPVLRPHGAGSSASSSKVPSLDPANPLGPRSGGSTNGIHTNGLQNGSHAGRVMSDASYTTALQSRTLPLEGKAVPNGLLAPSTPQRYTGIPGSPGSSMADQPVDVTDEIFAVLKHADAPLDPNLFQDIREILKKSFGKQRGYYMSREMARRERDRLRFQLEQHQYQHSHNENRGSLMLPPITPNQSFIPATQSFPSPSQSFGPPPTDSFVGPPPSESFVPSTPTPIRNGSQLSNTKEVAMFRAQNEGLRNLVDNLRKELKNAKEMADLHEKGLSEYGNKNNQLHNQVTKLTREIMELKEQIRKFSSADGEGSGKAK